MPTDTGLGIVPEVTYAEAPHPYAIVVPGGGRGTIQAMATPAVQVYLRAADKTAEVVASVCTGALVLAAAGLLEGRGATTHWGFADYLNRLGTRYRRARWVEDGKYITAAGVSAGIDMALFLAARLTSEDRARRIQAGIEYDPQPPSARWTGTGRTSPRTGRACRPPSSVAPTLRPCWKAARTSSRSSWDNPPESWRSGGFSRSFVHLKPPLRRSMSGCGIPHGR